MWKEWRAAQMRLCHPANRPHSEEPRKRRLEGSATASWFETRENALLTMSVVESKRPDGQISFCARAHKKVLVQSPLEKYFA
jgi:hypothetical protein